MAKAPNYIKQEYNRIRKNLMAQVRKLEKQGFFDAREKIPSIPKKITQGSINRLNKLVSNKYRGLKEGLENILGESVRDVEYKHRQEGARKRKEKAEHRREKAYDRWKYAYYEWDEGDTMPASVYADTVINNYLDELGGNDTFSSFVRDFLEGMRGIYDDSDVADMINRFADKGVLPSRWQLYTVEGAYNFSLSIFSEMRHSGSNNKKIEAVQALAQSTLQNYTGMFDTMRSDHKNAIRSARLAEKNNG